MSDVVISPQTLAVITSVVGSVVAALVTVVGGLVYVYRQDIRTRERLLDERERLIEAHAQVMKERDARMIDLWREMEKHEIRETTLEAANERLIKLAVDATEGWKDQVASGRVRPS